MDPRHALDADRARRFFDRAAPHYAETAVLSREVQRRLTEKLDFLAHRPEVVLDAGAGTGEGIKLLEPRYPKSRFLGLDFSTGMLREAVRDASVIDRMRAFAFGSRVSWICGDFVRLPLAAGSVDLVWSNLALSWASEPLLAFQEFVRVLRPGGVIMFSAYGPDTLAELKAAFEASDKQQHVHQFVDMHDLGDMLVAAGFANPVMEMERLTLTYPDVAALARDLRSSGQRSVARGRPRGLLTPRAWDRMALEYERFRRDGRIPATVEVVYGHAWKGEPRRAADGAHIVKVDFPTAKRR
jgi:malonyl-CoA O-methyltransferase